MIRIGMLESTYEMCYNKIIIEMVIFLLHMMYFFQPITRYIEERKSEVSEGERLQNIFMIKNGWQSSTDS